MSEIASHEPFGHLQHKLWLKIGPRTKLSIWLPTTKSQESTRSRCVQVECNTPLESSQGELQVRFRPCPNRRSDREVMNPQSLGSPNWDNFGTVWDSTLGVPGQRAIWAWVRWSNAENTIWGKVVASLDSRPWWVQWVSVARDLSQHQGCFQRGTNPLVVGSGWRIE
jgi:hypothetical protein